MENWEQIVIGILGVISGSAWLSPFVSSEKPWMKIIDALAGNWLKARNDREAQ